MACCKSAVSLFKRTFLITHGQKSSSQRSRLSTGIFQDRGTVKEGRYSIINKSACAYATGFPSPQSVCFPSQESMSPSLRICYQYLNQTSRSFAAVIQALDDELRHAVCIFYLVLRALDTVEDDMTIPLPEKITMLHNFHSYLYDPKWRYTESKEKDRRVLEDFPTITLEFRKLAQVYRDVIKAICQQMGRGMAEFLEKKVGTLAEWDRYCHYVAGLVGIGLSQLFSASELEDPILGQDTRLPNSLGLFLQKVNIIRDYLEDQQDGREFWPKEVWEKYAQKLSDFVVPENLDSAVKCLNELVTNALQHVPDVLAYLSRLKNQSVFNFCAIPQVMAMATLATCYNNPHVFSDVVKIRKGQAVTLMMGATNMEAVKAIMHQYCKEIQLKIPMSDPSAIHIQEITGTISRLTLTNSPFVPRAYLSPVYLSCAMLLVALSWQYLSTLSQPSDEYIKGL